MILSDENSGFHAFCSLRSECLFEVSMEKIEEKCLKFVLHYYQQGKLDTRKALQKFRHSHGEVYSGSFVRWYWMVAGIAAMLCIVGGIRLLLHTDADHKGWVKLVAEKSPVEYVLPDSSKVVIYPQSSVRYHLQGYLHHRREVQLEGEVGFSVRHDSLRPFTVIGRLSEVRVLGTEFRVNEVSGDTAFVQVKTGKVRLSTLGHPDAVILTAGMSAQVVKGQKHPQVNGKKKMEKGNFVFDNTPLPKVLEELSAYFHVRLKCENTSKRLTASFKAQSLDEIIEIIEKVLKVKIEKQE